MSVSYKNAQEQFDRDQLRCHYQQQSQSVPVQRMGTYNPRQYSMLQHYLPHGIGLGSIVIVGAVGLAAYNSHVKDAFESEYFSSW